MMEIYTVKPGDFLWQIAQTFKVSIQSIVDVNGLTDPGNLIIGMDLVIPTEKEQPAVIYTVKPGDTLWRISQVYNLPLIEVARANNIRYPYNLFIGQRLMIPVGEIYRVQRGDSLWAIATKFNISINTLISLNNLTAPYTIYPGQNLLVSKNVTANKPIIETLGYYNPSNLDDKTYTINTLGEYLTYLGLFDFPFDETGYVIGTIDEEILVAARRKNVLVMPVITNLVNGSFSPELGNMVLADPIRKVNLINNILLMLTTYDLQGIIIDIENLYPEDRELFTSFIEDLSERLHNENKILILNMPPKWEEWADREWVGFFDYNALGPLIDIAAIMTYEWGWREGPPRATTPLEYVVRSLNYAIENNVPSNKILMGMTLYGYDWTLPDTPQNLARAITLPEVWHLARRYNASIEFDQEVKQPYMDYVDLAGNQHRIWFVNARSHYLKYQLIERYNLRGVFYWILNQPLPATWYILAEMFDIKKY